MTRLLMNWSTLLWRKRRDIWHRNCVASQIWMYLNVHGYTECATGEEARIEAIKMARRHGWTYPKWYEFWRWKDTRPLDIVADVVRK